MSNIDTRSPFFPRSRNIETEPLKDKIDVGQLKKNSPDRTAELNDKTSLDAKVTIPDGVKDFSRIKKVAMSAPETDNSEKIARLKAQIEAGTYEIDYDALADKILMSEY
jgi:negative regulator of flagellin synthesis FlgM